MLSHLSVSLPPVVSPMDEDAVAPNPVCSALPHSEPPLPLLSLSYITPSCANDGLSGHRGVQGHIQGVRRQMQKKASHPERSVPSSKPARSPPPAEQRREHRAAMDEFFNGPAENHHSEQKDPETPPKEMDVSPDQTVVGAFQTNMASDPEATQLDMSLCEELPQIESSSVPKSWVIGPLFQSLKSKMASFTEIVMTPVKLLCPETPPPHMDHQYFRSKDSEGAADEAEGRGPEAAQTAPMITDSEDGECSTAAPARFSKKLDFDEPISDSPRQPDIFTLIQEQRASPTLVPSPHAPDAVSDLSELKNVSLLRSPKGQPSVHTQTFSRTSNNVDFTNEHVSYHNSNEADKPSTTTLLSSFTRLDTKLDTHPGTEGSFRCNKTSPGPALEKCLQNSKTISIASTVGDETGLNRSFIPQKPSRRREPATALSTNSQMFFDVEANEPVVKALKAARRMVVSAKATAGEDEAGKQIKRRKTAPPETSKKVKHGQKSLSAIGVTQGKCPTNSGMGFSTNKIRSVLPYEFQSKSKSLKSKAAPTKGNGITADIAMEVKPPGTPARVEADQLQHTDSVQRKWFEYARSGGGETRGTSSSPTERSRIILLDYNLSPAVGNTDAVTTELKQPLKRSKNHLSARLVPAGSTGTPKTKRGANTVRLVTKKSRTRHHKEDSSCFGVTPGEGTHSLHSDSSRALPDRDPCALIRPPRVDGAFLPNFAVDSDSTATQVPTKRRRSDNHQRRCRALHVRVRKVEEVVKSVTMEDAPLPGPPAPLSGNLRRSYSCPEMLQLQSHASSWAGPHSPHSGRAHTGPHHNGAHKGQRRTRRHTVCSVEVEREIAPLCLRKEVYPSRRLASCSPVSQHQPPAHLHSPSIALSALASCFLSSPLAFLSKRIHARASPTGPGSSNHFSFLPPSSSCSSVTSPACGSPWRPPVFNHKEEAPATADSNSSRKSSQGDLVSRQTNEEEDDGEDTSSSSQECEDAALREEKALSDSEIKVVQKHEEQRKVSSIRIRKTLPKPQTNLTPMGLPKPVRLKKKQFSLEEIYTNKNFNKPPESRLETIFEVPFSRKNGAESWCGQRRVKRFLEFPEVGEARRPKKPPVGSGKTGISSSRPRRGGFGKDGPSLSALDADSLLCTKLDQLNLWLIHDQEER